MILGRDSFLAHPMRRLAGRTPTIPIVAFGWFTPAPAPGSGLTQNFGRLCRAGYSRYPSRMKLHVVHDTPATGKLAIARETRRPAGIA